MPTLLELRRRTRSVRNTEQITRAMKMVATARLRRAQEAIVSARPFAARILEVLNSVVVGAKTESPPLLRERPPRRVEVVVITSDRGLCGSFNTNVLKRCEILLKSLSDNEVGVRAVGRKGKDHFRRRGVRLVDPLEDIFRALGYEHARAIAAPLMERYHREDPEDPEGLDAIYLVFNEFKNILRQDVRVERLLPLERLDLSSSDGAPAREFFYEPTEGEIFSELLPRHVEYQIWRALLESVAAEQAARMTAMDNATKNASELIADLTLTMNRVRQAAITKEILEVVGGAEALD
ncbi:MAG: ATP synthase F1 subunit gamma [Acidobacteria bacterium]|nr:ATP synthase F1 subunit gamma [Acidobacteriota bacterium]